MSNVRVIVVTGLPGTGKTTLARELSMRWSLPLIAKDLIKEPLLDVLGAADAAQSRRLSDASFAVLFDLARELAMTGVSFVLEGNFRPGEHEALLARALGRDASVAQVLCRVPEGERLRRIKARASHSVRHAGHRLGEQSSAPAAADNFLEIPSKRLVHAGADAHTVHAALNDWMNLRAPSP